MRKILFAALAAVTLAACNDKNDPAPTPAPGISNTYTFDATPNLTNPWQWVYITLNDGKTTTGDDAWGKANGNWDIAVLTYRAEVALRTNSGTSGNGTGGFLTTSLNIGVDEMRPIKYMAMGAGGPEFATKDVSWSGLHAMEADFDHGMPPTYSVVKPRYILSHDRSKLYKITFTGFYDDQGKPGKMTMVVEE